jgi:hypothetical protein
MWESYSPNQIIQHLFRLGHIIWDRFLSCQRNAKFLVLQNTERELLIPATLTTQRA